MRRSSTDEPLHADRQPGEVDGDGNAPEGLFEVGTARAVRALHVMYGKELPEGALHPHEYRIEVAVRSRTLDEHGMVCDLDELDDALAELRARIEGRDLGELIPDVPAVTVELLAQWVHAALRPLLATGPAASMRVRVFEHADAFASFTAELR